MVDYSLYRQFVIASAIRALRRIAQDPNCSDIVRLRATAMLLARMDFKSTSHD